MEQSELHNDPEDSFDLMEQKYKSVKLASAKLASKYIVPEYMRNILSIVDRYKSLMPSTIDRTQLVSRFVVPESMRNIASMADRYKNLIPDTVERTQLASRFTLPESMRSLVSMAERYRWLMRGSIDSSRLVSRFAVPESMRDITSIPDIYKSLVSCNIIDKTLIRTGDSGCYEPNSLKNLHGAANKYLDHISTEDLNSIVSFTCIYTGTAEGAAYIARNSREFNEIEPDAIAKLQNFKNKNPYVKKFRELPIVLQLTVYYFLIHVFAPLVEDVMKAEALKLFNKAGELIIQTIPINAYTKFLFSKGSRNVDWDLLKDFRVVTAHNVRLRDNPSMQGDVLELVEKYTVVAVLDKSNRKWLYVQISVDGKSVYGWINRTYTKPIKHN